MKSNEKYRGVVEAFNGYLLGGDKIARSSTFTEQTWRPHDPGALATRWTVVVAQANRRAGRSVGRIYVQRWDQAAKRWIEVTE